LSFPWLAGAQFNDDARAAYELFHAYRWCAAALQRSVAPAA
jgi:hypothetical protein